MALSKTQITKGFLLSGLMNSSVLIFSRFFTNDTIPEYDPAVLSNFGLMMIVVWGLAYISVAKNYERVKWLVGVFALEKLVYAILWTNWMMNNQLSEVYAKDTMAGLFYTVYGVNDWLFFGFFTFVFFRLLKLKEN